MKKTKSAMKARKASCDSTFEVDIAREFKEVKQSIAALAEEFRQWREVFNTQLTRLNIMMEQTLAKIADHEARISSLESKTDRHLVEVDAKAKAAGFWMPIVTWAFKAGVSVAMVAASAVGVAKALKALGVLGV